MEEEGELGSTCRGDDPPEAAMPEEKVGGASWCCAVGDDPPEAAMPEEKEEPGAGRLRVQFRVTKQNSIYKNSRSTASGGPILYNIYHI